jgi:hypothetical protein
MHSYQYPIYRLSLSTLCLAFVMIAACTEQESSSNSKINSANSSEVSSSNNSTGGSSVASRAVSQPKGTPTEQLTAILGTQADGWLPKVIADKRLKKGLSPDAVGKLFPGAENVSDYGFSKVAAQNVPGLKQYEFYYAKNSGSTYQLESIKLHFDPALNPAYPEMVKVLSSKYGAVKPEDVEQQTIVWVGPDFVTAQLMKLTDFGGYELNVSVEQ